MPCSFSINSSKTYGIIDKNLPHYNGGNANSQISKYYNRKKREKDSKRAAIAAARKLLTAMYYMLKKGEEYRAEG
ncbi:hypothetical protein AKJ57_06255 [candidate division MSBL1 archaeon SCGC-AAA259A05]|uniref:Uncharacterized protein n=1 Tax=candidate division MSBL1 archaeon SCGC-AAA259A05 TaxID=1698259 RepID=A0A133U3T3_9EURY|nr:hypothetical protein AKJ57_06255 [candidate division MSBL1 archaeon SCGC-AAA259A05]